MTGLGCGGLILAVAALYMVIGVCAVPFERSVEALVTEARAEPTNGIYSVAYTFEDVEYEAELGVTDEDPQWGADRGDTIELWVDTYDPEEPKTERYFSEGWWAGLIAVIALPITLVLVLGLPIDGIRWLLRRSRS